MKQSGYCTTFHIYFIFFLSLSGTLLVVCCLFAMLITAPNPNGKNVRSDWAKNFTLDGKKMRDYKKPLKDILELVGLSDKRGHTPRELSGGQQQRVAIARALIGNPEILFADEPTGNLDSHTGAEIMSLLQRINKERGQTIIMVTHSPEAAKSSNRIITVSDGVLEYAYLGKAHADD